MRPFAIVLCLLFASCQATTLQRTGHNQTDLTDTWEWTCCDDSYRGTFTLVQSGERVTGDFRDVVSDNGGVLSGRVSGSALTMTRVLPDGQRQEFTLEILQDGQVLEGTLSGNRNVSVGEDFIAERQ